MAKHKEIEKSTTGAWVLFAISMLYAISPVDIIPDVPIIGWIDDFFIATTGSLNLIQAELAKTNNGLSSLIQLIKWGVIGLGIIIILLLVLLGSVIVSLFTE